MTRKRQQAAEAEALSLEQPAPQGAETQAAEPSAGAASGPESAAAEMQPGRPQRDFKARRSWTEQYTGPLQYELFTAGKQIMFRFKLPKGQDKPSDDVLEVMRARKKNAEGVATGLRFEETRMHGKVWTVPNDAEGRELAAKIDMELSKLAKKLEPNPPLPA
jgi:hypothetical protein